jgi:hypothetical protein
MSDDEARDDPHHRRTLTMGRAGLLAVALASLALALAACGGGSSRPQVAGSGSSSKTTSSSSKSSSGEPLKYADCMRTHGLSDFPDPDSSGGFAMPQDIDPNSARYETAANACKAYAGSGLNLTPAREAQIEAHALKFAECMRGHGVPNYPDPTINFSNGGVSSGQDLGGQSGVDPKSPTFQAAQKACHNLGGSNGG